MEGKQDLETAVECAYRVPANRGSLWVALWLRPIPAEMALFLTGPRQTDRSEPYLSSAHTPE